MVRFMNKKYFIFSDVDGTLFSYKQCGIPKSSLDAIIKAMIANTIVAIGNPFLAFLLTKEITPNTNATNPIT